MMRTWIDADACPRAVKELVFRTAERLSIETYVVANQPIWVPRSNVIRLLQVGQGPDEADKAIVARLTPGDLVITDDIPLAARAVEAGAGVLTPRGERLDEENVGERLSLRDYMQGLRETGVDSGGPSTFGAREKRRFAEALDRILNTLR